MAIKTILTNDIKDLLGHEPSKAEFKSALDYLNTYVDDKTMLVDVELILRDWRSDCCTQCAGCGEYFLTELTEERFVGAGMFRVCGVDCLEEIKSNI